MRSQRSGWWLWMGTILFYMYQYLLRSEPATMHHSWAEEFHMTATQFASIGAIFLYAYGLLQIPMGWLLDRIGVKRVLLISVGLCLLGATLLPFARAFWMVQLSRMCMGIGSATPFICSMKIVQDSFPARRQAFFCGLTLTLGVFGAMCAGLPLQLMVERWGWRSSAEVLAWVGGAVFLVITFLFWRSSEEERGSLPTSSYSPRSLWREALTLPITRYAIMTIGLYAPLAVLVDMWGTPFLSLKYGVLREQIAAETMLGYLGLAIGSAVLPLMVRSQRSLHGLLLASLLGVTLLLWIIILAPPVPLLVLACLFFTLGFLCGSLMLCYPAIGLYTNAQNSGFIFGYANSLLMIGEGGVNFVIGSILDFTSYGRVDSTGAPLYTVSQYEYALGCILFPLLISCTIFASHAIFQKRSPVQE